MAKKKSTTINLESEVEVDSLDAVGASDTNKTAAVDGANSDSKAGEEDPKASEDKKEEPAKETNYVDPNVQADDIPVDKENSKPYIPGVTDTEGLTPNELTGDLPKADEDKKEEPVKDDPKKEEEKKVVVKDKTNNDPTISEPEAVNVASEDKKITEPVQNSVKYSYRLGSPLDLVNEPLYRTPYSRVPARKITGRYYIFDGKNRNGHYRITDTKSHVNRDIRYLVGYIKKS